MSHEMILSSATEINLADDKAGWVDILIIPDGEVKSARGTFNMGEQGFALIKADFDRRDVALVIDYEHQSLGGEYARMDGKAPAAGWIHELTYEKGRGIIAKVEWTAKARQAIRDGEYRYLSPVVAVRKDDRMAVGLHSVAVTNVPAIHGIERLAAKRKGVEMPKGAKRKTKKGKAADLFDRAKVILTAHQEATPEEEVAEAEAVVEEVDAVGAAIAELKAVLGLGEDVSPADAILAAVEKLGEVEEGDEGEGDAAPTEDTEETTSSVNSLRETLSLRNDAPLKDVVKAVDRLVVGKVSTKRLTDVEAELKVLRNESHAAKVEQTILALAKDGRLNPNDDDRMEWARKRATTDLVAFTELMQDAPKVWEPGRIVDDGDSFTPADSREKLIAFARKDWNDNPDQRMGASTEAWINTVLVTENKLSPMTAKEKKALVV